MTNKKNWFGILAVVVLIFGMMIVGCDDDGRSTDPITGKRETFTVSFEINGHGNSIGEISVGSGELIYVWYNNYDGDYYCLGWYKEPELTNRWDLANDRVYSDITLYAKWINYKNLFVYEVTFISDGYTFNSLWEVYEDTRITDYEGYIEPTKYGYVFDGWYQNAQLTSYWHVGNKVDSNLNLYAKWTTNYQTGKEKPAGAVVSTPTLSTKTSNSIIINDAVFTNGNPGYQTIEYGRSTTNSTPTSWQGVTTFSGLNANTTYYIFARSMANATHDAGTPSAGLSVTTDPQGKYNIGDVGPGLGIIFYYDPNGFRLTDTGETAYYLEVSVDNLGSIPWSSASTTVIGTESAIGTGRRNTGLITSTFSTDTVSNNASKACEFYSYGGKTDWFLPSIDELDEMRKQRTVLGMSSNYWSSTQASANNAYYEVFSNGNQTSGDKLTSRDVYAVRYVLER